MEDGDEIKSEEQKRIKKYNYQWIQFDNWFGRALKKGGKMGPDNWGGV
jgi:hypothetical protein